MRDRPLHRFVLLLPIVALLPALVWWRGAMHAAEYIGARARGLDTADMMRNARFAAHGFGSFYIAGIIWTAGVAALLALAIALMERIWPSTAVRWHLLRTIFRANVNAVRDDDTAE